MIRNIVLRLGDHILSKKMDRAIVLLEQSIKEQKRLYRWTVGITILTIFLLIFTLWTVYVEIDKSDEERKTRKKELVRAEWLQFDINFVGKNDQTFQEIIAPENDSVDAVLLADMLNCFEDMNIEYREGDLDLKLADRHFHRYVYQLVNSPLVNRFILDSRSISLTKDPSDSVTAGGLYDAIFIWAKRFNIKIRDNPNSKDERFYYRDDAKREHFFSTDTTKHSNL